MAEKCDGKDIAVSSRLSALSRLTSGRRRGVASQAGQQIVLAFGCGLNDGTIISCDCQL
jgi:hypothetical protein